jgi:DNA polymerase-3 subunit epsilon
MPVLALDIESTGVDVETARIVTIALVLVDDDGTVLKSQEWLVRPDGYEIPADATAVHGITTEYAREEGWPILAVLNWVAAILVAEWDAQTPLVAQNAVYDLTVLDREFRRSGFGFAIRGPVLDPYVLDQRLVPKRRGKGSRRLQAVAEAYNVPLSVDEAHGATADALAAARIALKQLDSDLLRGIPLQVIHEAQIGWKRDQAYELTAYFRSVGNGEHVNAEWPLIEWKGEA